MLRYNPKANYQPNAGRYLQILSGKDLYKQTIVVGAGTHDTFSARFPILFVDYTLGQMCVGDKLWTNWNKAPFFNWNIYDMVPVSINLFTETFHAYQISV